MNGGHHAALLDEDKTTLAEMGRPGVTKERIRQIEGKALSKLKLALADRGIEGGLLNSLKYRPVTKMAPQGAVLS